MADSKITALTSIGASTDPANDPLVLVDVSDTSMAATGTTKKVTLNQLLGAGGTATLASATITGDLTVDTSTLKVDSANNRVGIVKTTPAYPLDVGGRISYSGAIGEGADTTISSIGTSLLFGNAAGWADCQFFAGGNSQYRIQSAGVFTWYDGAGGTRMTLNSTGLGVGVTPATKFHVKGGLPVFRLDNSSTGLNQFDIGVDSLGAYFRTYVVDGIRWYNAAGGIPMTLAASGNLLIGKTGENGTVGAGIIGQADGSIWSTMAASTSASNTLLVYSTGAAAYRFYVNLAGTVFATNTTISAISDARFKENVQDIDVGLGAILALKPRKFDWKEGKGKNIKGDRGFIAQEFEQVFPNLVDEWADSSPEGEAPYKSVRQDLIPVLVKAIQELTARVEALEA